MPSDVEPDATHEPRLALGGDIDHGWFVELTGVPTAAGIPSEGLAVYTGGSETIGPGRRAILGEMTVEGPAARWRPRFGLDPGQQVTAVWSPPSGESVTATFTVPAVASEPTTVVSAVHPTASTIPENLLRLYVQFSAPMSQGGAARFIRLLGEAGEVRDAFVVPEQELWSPDGTRLTLFFDPGRLKQDVGPNLELGPPLREGQRVRLRIDGAWLDARGLPLAEGFEASWTVGPADRQRPSVEDWRVEAPAGPIAPVVIALPEPLDHALLERMIVVEDEAGTAIAGVARAQDDDRRWIFLPERPWAAGSYRLRVEPTLEDLAGNSLARLFDEPLVADRVGVPAMRPPQLAFVVPPSR